MALDDRELFRPNSTQPGIKVRWPPALIEFLILIAVLSFFPMHRAPINACCQKGVNLALGLHHRGDYPFYSLPFYDYFFAARRQAPSELMRVDLRSALSPAAWPTERFIPWFFRGSEAGEAFGIYYLWKSTGTFTLGMVSAAYQLLHLLGVLALFLALSRLNVHGVALFSSLIFAYSPAVIDQLSGHAHSLVMPVFMALALCLAGFGISQNPSRFGWRTSCLFLSGLILAWGAALRTTTKFILIPVLGFYFFKLFAEKLKIRTAILIIACLLGFGLGKLTSGRLLWNPQRVAVTQLKEHVFWHAVYTGLCEFPNPYGIVCDDRSGAEYVYNLDPKIEFSSAEYESAIRARFFSMLRENPLWYAKVLAKRMIKFSQMWIEFLPMGDRNHPLLSSILFVMSVAGVIYFSIKQKSQLLLFHMLAWFSTLAIPILVYASMTAYNLPTYLALSVALVFSICMMIKRTMSIFLRL